MVSGQLFVYISSVFCLHFFISCLFTSLISGAMEKKQILPPQSLQGSEVHFAQVTWADQGTKFAVTWFVYIFVSCLCTFLSAVCLHFCQLFVYFSVSGLIEYKMSR